MAIVSDSNVTPATGAEAIYRLKELLKSAGWSVVKSSTGSVYSSSSDLITSAAVMATSSAWFVIRSPTLSARNIEWCFQRGATNLVWRIKVSDNAGFSGGSPSATQVPSASDEIVMHGSGTDASPTYATLTSTDGTYRFSVLADSSAPYKFVAVAWVTGGSSVSTLIWQDPLTSTESGDSATVVYGVSGGGSDPAAFSSLSADAAKSRAKFGASFVPCPMLGGYNASGTQVYPGGLGTTAAGSDSLIPIVYGRRSGLGGVTGYKGISSVFRWNGTSRAIGDTVSVASTKAWVMLTDVAMFWDGTTPVV